MTNYDFAHANSNSVSSVSFKGTPEAMPVGALSEIDSLAHEALERAGSLLKRASMIADDLFGAFPEPEPRENGTAGCGRLAVTADTLRNLNSRLNRLDDQISRLGNLS